jgi:hypothetical protein
LGRLTPRLLDGPIQVKRGSGILPAFPPASSLWRHRAAPIASGAAFAEKWPPGRPKSGHPADAPPPGPAVHWRRGGGRYSFPTTSSTAPGPHSLAAPTLHITSGGAAFSSSWRVYGVFAWGYERVPVRNGDGQERHEQGLPHNGQKQAGRQVRLTGTPPPSTGCAWR